jgi:hypothetical protein
MPSFIKVGRPLRLASWKPIASLKWLRFFERRRLVRQNATIGLGWSAQLITVTVECFLGIVEGDLKPPL